MGIGRITIYVATVFLLICAVLGVTGGMLVIRDDYIETRKVAGYTFSDEESATDSGNASPVVRAYKDTDVYDSFGIVATVGGGVAVIAFCISLVCAIKKLQKTKAVAAACGLVAVILLFSSACAAEHWLGLCLPAFCAGLTGFAALIISYYFEVAEDAKRKNKDGWKESVDNDPFSELKNAVKKDSDVR